MVNYDNIKFCYFSEKIYNYTNIKKLLFDTITYFEHILNGLLILNENNICYFNISPTNIVFLSNYREKPTFMGFSLSLKINKLKTNNSNYYMTILENIDEFTYLPFEIHLLYFIHKYNMDTISYSHIEDFCDEFVNHLSILNLFSNTYRNQYKKQCYEVMQQYVNKSKQQIIDTILGHHNKWDIYGISVIYLQIFGNFATVFSLKNTIINRIINCLIQNIHPNPNIRNNIERTLILYNELLNDEINWCFVNKLDENKLSIFYDKLSK
jgi:hypothetical protein